MAKEPSRPQIPFIALDNYPRFDKGVPKCLKDLPSFDEDDNDSLYL